MVRRSPPTVVVVLAFSLSGRSGEAFCIQPQYTGTRSWRRCKTSCLRQPGGLLLWTYKSARLGGQTAVGQTGGAQDNYPYDTSNDSIADFSSGETGTAAKDAQVVADYTSGGAQTQGSAPDGANPDSLLEEERLHREVFSNEAGYLSSNVYNPVRARRQAEEEESARLAAEWGSTPEQARKIIQQSKKSEDMSFQELDHIASELKLTDEQQRAFMLRAGIEELAKATALPRRTGPSAVESAVADRVFASEGGFLKNSEEFKARMKLGAGVRFDADGFPIVEGDPTIEAARRRSKELKLREAGEEQEEEFEFPMLPDCPRCSAPATEVEMERFGMCSQCKAQEHIARASETPPMATRYTYDNGEAPFSSSWNVPPSDRPVRSSGRSDQPITTRSRSNQAGIDNESSVGSSSSSSSSRGGRAAAAASAPRGRRTPLRRRVETRPSPPAPSDPERESESEAVAGVGDGLHRWEKGGAESREGEDGKARRLSIGTAAEEDPILELKREVSELRSQLSEARLEQSQARSALQELRRDMEVLAERLAVRERRERRGRGPPSLQDGLPSSSRHG